MDDVFEALVEGVLNDFTQDVSDCLLNLFVDSVLNVLFWVGNVDVVTFVLEDSAIALVVKVE